MEQSINGEVVAQNVGKNWIYPTPQVMAFAVENYFADCENASKKPSVMGMCIFLGISQSSLQLYKQREGFADIVEQAKERCERAIFELALENKVNPNVAMAYMKAKHGWTEKTEQDVKQETTIKIETMSYKDSIQQTP